MPKSAFITGVTGQDGSYLTETLLEKGYVVHGIIRRASVFNTARIEHLMNDKTIYNKRLFLHHGDLGDTGNLGRVIAEIKPDEIYNLGAQSHVAVSFELPEYTTNVNSLGALRMLEAIRVHSPDSKFYQASTSEIFGGQLGEMPPSGFNESSIFHPRSPYGTSKLYAHWITRNYRESYNLFACSGLLFNHESPRRGDTFVTKKITNWLKKRRAAKGKDKVKPLQLGNLYAARDWGHAKDFVYAIWLILQHKRPDDFVIATGETHSVKDFVNECFRQEGGETDWRGEGMDEKCYVNGELCVEVNPIYFRPSEVDFLRGDATKAKKELGWKPRYGFKEIVADMREN